MKILNENYEAYKEKINRYKHLIDSRNKLIDNVMNSKSIEELIDTVSDDLSKSVIDKLLEFDNLNRAKIYAAKILEETLDDFQKSYDNSIEKCNWIKTNYSKIKTKICDILDKNNYVYNVNKNVISISECPTSDDTYNCMHDVKELLADSIEGFRSNMGQFIPERKTGWTALEFKIGFLEITIDSHGSTNGGISATSRDGIVSIIFKGCENL